MGPAIFKPFSALMVPVGRDDVSFFQTTDRKLSFISSAKEVM